MLRFFLPSFSVNTYIVPFYYCSGLTEVTIGSGVTEIGYAAFFNCSGLTEVTIGSGVTEIGSSAFTSCNKLTSIVIPDSVTSISDWAFSGCTSLTSVTLGSGVTSIGYAAFSNCSGLTGELVIPDSVTSIESSAFQNCSGLTGELVIPDSVTSIGSSAFKGCSGFTELTIGSGVTEIGSSAFSSCKGLTSIVIPDSVISIGDSAFYYCSSLTSVTIGSGVTSIGDDAFYGCNALPVENNLRYADTYLVGAVDNNQTTYTIKEGTKWVGSRAFSSCSGLTSIVIPDSVISIGNSAFSNCKRLTSIDIPDSLISIGSYAFNSCSGLTSIVIPNSVTSIGDSAFQYCSNLSSITCYATTAPSVSNSTFTNIKSKGILFHPIGSNYSSWLYLVAYRNWVSIELTTEDVVLTCTYNITNPNSATQICNYPIAIESMTIDGVEVTPSTGYTFTTTGEHNIVYNLKGNIPAKMYSGCTSLTSINLSDSVTSIGNSAFYNCKGLTGELVIPDSVISIGDSAFYICSGLTSVTLGSGVTSIGDSTFRYCESLTSINIPNSVTSIGEIAFQGCSGLTSIVIPDSVTSIGNSAFQYCSGLTGVTIGSGVTYISYWIFDECSSLTAVYYNSTMYNWENIEKDPSWIDNSNIERIICTDGVIEIENLFTPAWFDGDSAFWSGLNINVGEEQRVYFNVYNWQKQSQVLEYSPDKKITPYFYYDYNPEMVSITHESGKENAIYVTGLQSGTTTITLWAGPGEKEDVSITLTVNIS